MNPRLEFLRAVRHEEEIMVRTVVEVLTRQRAGGTPWEIDWCLHIGQARVNYLLRKLEADGEVRRRGTWGRGGGIVWTRVGVAPAPVAEEIPA